MADRAAVGDARDAHAGRLGQPARATAGACAAPRLRGLRQRPGPREQPRARRLTTSTRAPSVMQAQTTRTTGRSARGALARQRRRAGPPRARAQRPPAGRRSQRGLRGVQTSRAQLHHRLVEVARAPARHLRQPARVQRRARRRHVDRTPLAGQPRQHAHRVAVEREGRARRTRSPPPPPPCRARRPAARAAPPPSPGSRRRARRRPPPPPGAGCGRARSSRGPTRAP